MPKFVAEAGADRWEVDAWDQYQAAVTLRAELHTQGAAMPVEIEWEAPEGAQDVVFDTIDDAGTAQADAEAAA